MGKKSYLTQQFCRFDILIHIYIPTPASTPYLKVYGTTCGCLELWQILEFVMGM